MTDSSSILAADFGSVYTRVLLIDAVDGEYRLVGRAEVRSTGGFPTGDVTIGLRQAIERIQRVTGRNLIDPNGFVITPEGYNRSGVDYFVTTASGGRPVTAVIVGLMPGVSIESGLHATQGTYVEVMDLLSLSDERDEEDQLNALLLTYPDLLLIVGGTEGGAIDPLKQMLQLVKASLIVTRPDSRPYVLYAGNSAAVDTVKEMLEPLTKVSIADNVRPTLNEEDLENARIKLGAIFDDYKESQGRGFDKVSEMSSLGLLPTAQSYGTVVEFLGRARERKLKTIVAVDVGSSSSTLATFANGEVRSAIRTDIGLGTSAPSMVQNIEPDDIRRWLPFSVAEADLLNYALNKSIRPGGVPTSRTDLYLEHALLRAGIEDMLYDQRPNWRTTPPEVDWIIGAGGALTNTGNPGITAMLLADAIESVGITELYTDPNCLIPVLGPLAYLVPEAVIQMLDGDDLEFVGTLFAVDGAPSVRRATLTYTIEFDDGEKLEESVDGGAFQIIELPPGKTAKIRIKVTEGGVRMGGKRRLNLTVRGGTAGIIIDTRGRPIPQGVDIERRMLQLMRWYSFASQFVHEEIPESQLQPIEERYPPDSDLIMVGDTLAEDDEPEVQPRRGLFGRSKPQVSEDEQVLEELLNDEDVDVDELEALFGSDDEEL